MCSQSKPGPVGRVERQLGGLAEDIAVEDGRLAFGQGPRCIARRRMYGFQSGWLGFHSTRRAASRRRIFPILSLVLESGIDAVRLDWLGHAARLRRRAPALRPRGPAAATILQRFLDPRARTGSHRTESGFMVGTGVGGLLKERLGGRRTRGQSSENGDAGRMLGESRNLRAAAGVQVAAEAAVEQHVVEG